ncbi:MAG: hypothetical protein KO464_05610 [Candidatus Methanofastidiosum sp.]|nr:hypothetical protein [Methanofastidiosum sp.]
MALNKTQLLAILAILVNLVGQLGFSNYADLLQTIGSAVISILVLFGLVQLDKVEAEAKKLRAAMLKAKLIKE